MTKRTNSSDRRWLVAALYKFVDLPGFANLREPLLDTCRSYGVLGTILLAKEGINGTIAGHEDGVRAVLSWLRRKAEFSDLDVKESHADQSPFNRMKVRLKREIVTLGAGELNPAANAGTYVEGLEWNELISDPDTIVIDTRNDYEVAIGTFEGAINPQTASFSELPDWVEEKLEADPDTKIAMFCTGGIRCEKSTALLKSKGFGKVFHLKGGILKYLETVPEEQSLWRGECFVFDQRVSIGHGLEQGSYDLCHACRMPLTQAQKQSRLYVEGVSCPLCHDKQTAQQRQRFAERQKQIGLARKRGTKHIALDVGQAKMEKKAAAKRQRECSDNT